MQIRIVEYTEEMRGALVAFNQRLADRGATMRFSVPDDRATAPPTFHHGLPQKRFLAVDEDSTMRGGYVLKFQEFQLAGEKLCVADFQLPISEGIVDKAYTQVAVRLLLDAEQRQPLMYGLGMGGFDVTVARFLQAAGWTMFSVPFYFRIVRPTRFLKNIEHLRRTSLRRVVLDMLAYSGLGWIAVKTMNLRHRAQSVRTSAISTEAVPSFGPWADELWDAYRSRYGFCSLRDARTLSAMYPEEAMQFTRLRMTDDGRTVGWAIVMNHELQDHNHFGNMQLGSIVDCFSIPDSASAVIYAARAWLEEHGVDLIVSNQSHRIWRDAFAASGFMTGPSNFIFTSSKALTARMKEKDIREEDVHVDRGDGDGPINL